MAKDLLLEIGLEEMPARMVPGAVDRLKGIVRQWLEEKRIQFEEIITYATPRRLAVHVRGAADRQLDVRKKSRGPALSIARNEQGEWTKAALGFARSQGIAPEELVVEEYKGTAYVFASVEEKGQELTALLPEGMKHWVESMTFPKSMRWGSERLRYVRPIRWIVALAGSEVVPFAVAGVQTGRQSDGHRFLGQKVSIPSPEEYTAALEKEKVILSPQERERRIREGIAQLEREQGWHIPIDEDLMEEVVYLVEYPTVMWGGFDPSFLEIPREVLITSMREHQRYFPVVDENSQLLPYFVTVRNGDQQHLDVVRRGNEKVLRARLSDARFFYQEDKKVPIPSFLEKLEKVVYHEGLGSLGDKRRRLVQVLSSWAGMFGLDAQQQQELLRAADICKFDLVTQMVYEFPELQGIMGREYARAQGEQAEVAEAIFEHYLPRFAGDALPRTQSGRLLAMADKLDALVGFFSKGLIPSGSQDPYALRRQAAGVASILVDGQFLVTPGQLIQAVVKAYRDQGLLEGDTAGLESEVLGFLQQRLRVLLQDGGIGQDIVDALFFAQPAPYALLAERARELKAFVAEPSSRKAIEAFTRLGNLAKSYSGGEFSPEALTEEQEQVLWQVSQEVARKWEALSPLDAKGQLALLTQLEEPIHQFFTHIMVMVEDEEVRHRRLALLHHVRTLLMRYADFGMLLL